MERNEIEAELNEVERDLADIARRVHIAASNLRSVADGLDCQTDDPIFELMENIIRRFERGCVIIKDSASSLQMALGETMATAKAFDATVAARGRMARNEEMKKEDEAFKTLYTVDVIDKKGDPWRVLAAYRHRSEAEAAVCRAIMVGIYHGVQMSKWNKKWVSE